MKTPWIVLFAVVAGWGLAAGVMWRTESTQATRQTEEVTKLKVENARLTEQAVAATEKARALESESAQLRAARALAGSRLEPVESPTPAEAEAKPKGPGGFLAKMLKDPEMRKMMAAQQASVLRGFYSDFVKQAHLTPDEVERFYQVLADRQTALMDSSANMMSGSAVDLKATTAVTNASDDALKQLLGPARYGQYQDFEKTLGDRIQVQQFNQQLGAEGSPLQDSQSQALIKIMSEEQANMPSFKSPNGAGMKQAMNMSQADIDQYAQQVEATNQRVYIRAASVLTPAQLPVFKTFQSNMENAQVAGLKMTQQMFKGDQ